MTDDRDRDPGFDPDFDEILVQLGSPPLPSELTGEASAVAAMTAAFNASGVTPMQAARSRRFRVATMVAAGVIGFGGAAAAGPDGFDLPGTGSGKPAETTTTSTTTTSTTSTTTTSTTTVAPSTSTSSTTAAPATSATTLAPPATAPTTAPTTEASVPTSLVDDPATAFDETQCAPGNHGKTVSSVAQSVPPGPGHGEQVSEAAHSSCGKDSKADKADKSDNETPDADEDESEHDESEHNESDDDVEKPEKVDKPQNPGNGNGSGTGDDAGKDRSGRDG